MKFYGIISSFDTNTTIEFWFYKNNKKGDTMKTNNSKQQDQQKKQNQSVKKNSGNPKLDGENRPST